MSLVQVRKSSRKKKKTSKIVEMAIDDEDQVVALKAKRARKRKSKESTYFDEAEMDVQKTSNIVQSLSNDFDTITPTNIMCKPVSSSRSDARKRKERGGYRCAKCGQPKKGHLCPFRTMYAEMGTQCDLKITAPNKRFKGSVYMEDSK